MQIKHSIVHKTNYNRVNKQENVLGNAEVGTILLTKLNTVWRTEVKNIKFKIN